MNRVHWLTRLSLLGVVLVLLNGALVRHLYCLQISRHGELHEKARRKCMASRTQAGQRGRIFDVGGNLLAGNLACRDILAEPRLFRCPRAEIIETLSRELDVPRAVLGARFSRSDDPRQPLVEVTVKRGVDVRLAEHLDRYEFRGIRGVDTYCRFYPKGPLLANLLGFLDAEGRGAGGVEQLMEAYVSPGQGMAVYERDRRGNRLVRGLYSERLARDGWDVYLTIHEPIQQIVEEELAEMVERCAPRSAYAVMMDPSTGAVLALAQLPSFDPNDRSTMADPECWQNRILTHGFEPGSIMKSVVVCGALDYGVVTLDSTFDCEHGTWVYMRRPLRDSGHAYDVLSVREIIQKSSNIGTAKIALAMGDSRVYQVLRRFGFGSATGIGFRQYGEDGPVLFPTEATGILRDLPEWDSLSVTRFPIGQGILVTPLQMVQAYSALANEGVMMQPYIVDRIRDPRSGEERYSLPRAKARAVRPEAAREIVAAMSLVTQEGGTATRAAVEGYGVAGKTGTAQKWIGGPNGKGGYYSHSQCVSSFIGMVPAEAPAFVLLVVADEVTRGSRYGGIAAAPTFSRIAERTLRYLQVAPAGTPTACHLPGAGATEGADAGAFPGPVP
ncbi:MAG: penicillin-binding protein 2 [Lentisphaeria bacterium]|nr:penicillin-binding protein 2 [Lentisphaeria bacterium]